MPTQEAVSGLHLRAQPVPRSFAEGCSWFEHCSDAVLFFTSHGPATWLNQAARRLLAERNSGAAEALPLRLFQMEGTTALRWDQLPPSEVLHGGQPLPVEVILDDPAAPECWLRISAYPVHDERGALLRCVCVLHDITDSKREQRALERRLDELRELAVVDELTGLFNRRGFLTVASHQLCSLRRSRSRGLLVFADLDEMKAINDRYGHIRGDQALIDVAVLLRKTFRESDIVARLGGDEFVVLAAQASLEGAESVTARLREQLAAYNAHRKESALAMSWGALVVDPEEEKSIDELLRLADERMYLQKKSKRASLVPPTLLTEITAAVHGADDPSG